MNEYKRRAMERLFGDASVKFSDVPHGNQNDLTRQYRQLKSESEKTRSKLHLEFRHLMKYLKDLTRRLGDEYHLMGDDLFDNPQFVPGRIRHFSLPAAGKVLENYQGKLNKIAEQYSSSMKKQSDFESQNKKREKAVQKVEAKRQEARKREAKKQGKEPQNIWW